MKKFDNYLEALESLSQAPEQDLTNEFVQAGVINKFVLQFELSWKLLKALLAVEGDPKAATGSPRDVLKASFSWLDCLDEETWLSMLRDRNTVTHIYDAKNAELLAGVMLKPAPSSENSSTARRRRRASEVSRASGGVSR